MDDGSINSYDRSLRSYFEYLTLQYGSSLDGRYQAFEHYTGVRYKKGIVVSNRYQLYFIMTRGIDADETYAINYLRIRDYHKRDSNTLIIFDNGIEQIVKADYRVIKRQMDNMYKYIYAYNNAVRE